MVVDLPPADRERPDPKPQRPYVLVSDVSRWSDVANLVYCTTKGERLGGNGEPSVCVRSGAPTFAATGFHDTSFLAPGRLHLCDWPEVRALGYPRGRIIDDMPPLWDALERALGIGQGPRGLRGTVARLRPGPAAAVGTDLGLIVSDGLYSMRRLHQNIVPILDATECAPSAAGVRTSAPWVREVGNFHAALLVPWAVQSVYTKWDIQDAAMPSKVPAALLEEIDDAFRARFFHGVNMRKRKRK